LLRIKDGHLFIKNLDYILKDKLNISDCLPPGLRMNRSNSRENEFNEQSPKFAENPEHFYSNMNYEDEEINNETMTVQDIKRIP